MKNLFLPKRKLITFLVIILTPFIAGFFSVAVYASATNIDSTHPNHFAWSDTVGWFNFHVTNSVVVSNAGLDGFARFGPENGPHNFLSFNCATGPTGSSCSPVNYRVTNDASGNLAGWAWSDVLGWVSFNCRNPETGGSAPNFSCSQSSYQVKIDAQGELSGFAWSDIAGWISFNCNQTETGNQCAASNYRVRTAWVPGPVRGVLESGTFDTDRYMGAAFNYIVWRGTLNGGRVGFQFATSNCANGATNAPTCDQNIGWGGTKTFGDGAFLGPAGTAVETDIYLPLGANMPVEIRNQSTHNNRKYFRYRTYIETDASQTNTPVIEDIIVNWSP